MNKTLFALTFLVSTAAFAHGAGHLKGIIATADGAQLTVTTEEKEPKVVAFDKDTRFENGDKASKASALAPGLRVVVHLKAGTKSPIAALVKFSAPAAVRIEVAVTGDGFLVGKIPVLKAGTPVTLVVTRKVEATCATEIVLKEFGLSVPLPLAKPVEVTFVPKAPGKVHFACAMDMVSGDLQVE